MQRYTLGFMGCYAAFPALRMAAQFCEASAEAVVLVVVDNDRARRMYEADGWVVDSDEVIADALGVSVPEIRYRRSLPG